jgi:hypothetical protein
MFVDPMVFEYTCTLSLTYGTKKEVVFENLTCNSYTDPHSYNSGSSYFIHRIQLVSKK